MYSKKQHTQNEHDLKKKREEILQQMIREAEEDGLYDLDFKEMRD